MRAISVRSIERRAKATTASLCAIIFFASAIPSSAQHIEQEPTEWSFARTQQLLQQSCADCHAGGASEGGFSLEELQAETSLKDAFTRWQKVRQRIAERSMPPADAEPLDQDEIFPLLDWIEDASVAALCADGPQAGPPLLRRLARYEYSNTMRDLLNVHFDVGEGLPQDIAGGEGFANAAETLIISPIHAEKYLQAATDALDYVERDAGARRRLLPVAPQEAESPTAAARQNLQRLAARAFRRPVTADEVERFVQIYEAASADGLKFDQAVLYAMRGILISPHFLFITESNPAEPNVAESLTDHELAVRLSYFLWASAPDRQLRQLADAGQLNKPDVLKEQTIRLLKERGTHLQDSMEQFMGSWLGTADLGYAKQFDAERFPRLKEPDIAALRKQPVVAMESILQNNDSLLDLIDAPWTFLNNELVRVYRLQRNKISDEFVQRLVRVTLPEEYRYRGGLLGMGGVMALNSHPRRTSPVLRGAWVMEKMLGVELPPPPADVPDLDESQHAAEADTLRARLEQHRADPSCATCHDRIDPLGFALENFDELGRWRDKDAGGEIDTKTVLADGTEIDGVAGLKQHLLREKDTFIRVLTRKMLAYSLGRSLQPPDLCTVELIVERVKQNDYRAQELILGIVESEPFRKKIVIQEEAP